MPTGCNELDSYNKSFNLLRDCHLHAIRVEVKHTINKAHFWWFIFTYGVNTIAISTDGKTIVSGGYDDKIKVWDIQTGYLHHTLTGHSKC